MSDSQVAIAEEVPLPAERFFKPMTPAVIRIEMIKITTRSSMREKPDEPFLQERFNCSNAEGFFMG
jgi:hypothetical protein